jgi:hypothetical protein
MFGHNDSTPDSNRYGVGPSFVIVPVATVALATLAGLLSEKDQYIYWALAFGSIAFVVWAILRWPAPVPGPIGKSARMALFAGLGLFAVGQFLLGMVEVGREQGYALQTLTNLNNAGGMFGVFGALVGLPGFVLTVTLVVAVRLGWTEGWRLGALCVGIGVGVVALIAAIVSAF